MSSDPWKPYVCNQRQRPGRRPPKASAIADHWLRDDETSLCWRCGFLCRAERAHLIDRMYGGLDGPQNMHLICPQCHDEMPSFAPGQELAAIGWATSDDLSKFLAVCARRYVLLGYRRFQCVEDIDERGWFESKCWTLDDFDLMVNVDRQAKSELESAYRSAGWMDYVAA